VNPIAWNALRQEVLPAAFLGHQENAGNGVRHHPINLLRHGTVKAAQARFHVDHRNLQFCGNQRASDGRVYIADNQHRGRAFG